LDLGYQKGRKSKCNTLDLEKPNKEARVIWKKKRGLPEIIDGGRGWEQRGMNTKAT